MTKVLSPAGAGAAPLQDMGVGSWPIRRARLDPDAVALTQGERSLTYGHLADRVDRIASGLLRAGVASGDRVAFLGLNDINTFEVFFAVARAGAVFAPLSHRLAPAEADACLAEVGASVIVVGDGVDTLAEQLFALPNGHAASLLIVRTGGRPRSGEASLDDLASCPPLATMSVSLDDPALLLFTSGTTGRSKAAMLTHGNLTWNTINQLVHLDILTGERALCIAPLFHAVGLGQVILPVLLKGGRLEVLPRFDAGEVLRLVEEQKVSSFSCVPTMLQLMTEHPDWLRRDLSSLRTVLYGGSPADSRVIAAWRERDIALQQGYGMTEAGPGAMMATRDGALAHPDHVGVPHMFTDIAAAGHDGRPSDVPLDAPYELMVRGPHVFTGYWGREAATAEALTDDWYRTGDVLRTDADGWSRVVDRVTDVIISGGENIYPAEVETVLLAVPGVRSAAVVARPDARWGEVGVAFVEPADNEEGLQLNAAGLISVLEEKLARFKVPASLEIIRELPRTPTGKVLRTDLRARAVASPNQKEPTS